MFTPAPRAVALAALVLLPAAAACSSSRSDGDRHADEADVHVERRLHLTDYADDDGAGDAFEYDTERWNEGDALADLFGGEERSVIHIRRAGRELKIQKEGEVDYDPETGTVTPLGADARFVVDEANGARRRVVVTRGAGGAPAYRYTVGGEEQPFGAGALAWMHSTIGSLAGHSARDEHASARRAHRDAMRAHRDQMREHRRLLRSQGRDLRVHQMRSAAADSLRKRITVRDGVLTAIDDDGEVVVIDLDSLISTSMSSALQALDEMDFDFDFDFDFDSADFQFSREQMEAEQLREQAVALEEAAAELRREADAMRREAEAAAREAERNE